jgi:hypothetical protein
MGDEPGWTPDHDQNHRAAEKKKPQIREIAE